MKQKIALMVGGSHAEIPLIKELQMLGFFVISTGNNDDGLGHKFSDKYVKGDFSNKDFVLQLAREESVDVIISGCNDFAYISTAYACEELGIKGHDTYSNALIIHHKNEFRKVESLLNVRTPYFKLCKNKDELLTISENMNFPIVIKPVDLTGGKGIKICNNKQELIEQYDKTSMSTRQSFVLIEEYIVGSNHGASLLLKNQKVIFCFDDNELYYHNKYLVAGTYTPSTILKDTRDQLINDVEKIANYLNLVDGLFHLQFIVEENGMPVIIDPCRRSPGDLYVKFAEYATSVNLSKQIVLSEIGTDFENCQICSWKNIIRACIMANTTGVIKRINIADEIKTRVIDSMVWAKGGDVVDDMMTYKAGILFIKCENEKETKYFAENFYNYVSIELE